jgi:DNA-binding cell septation regulator SpoVG
MEKILVTEIEIAPVSPKNGLVAFATCALNNMFFLGELAIYTSPLHPLGHRIVFPTKKLASGKNVPCFYPFNKEAEQIITKAIVKRYVELMDKFHHIN